MADRALTIKIVGDSRAFRRAAKDAVSALDDTESAGKRLATEMDRMSRAMEQDLRDAAAATEVLETALGDDTVQALQSVGRNVQDMVAEWRQAGITYDEIRADADLLADTLRRSVQVGRELGTIAGPAGEAEAAVKSLGDQADTTRARIDDVGDSGDQSRNVLANMVGNSTQDLGELGGVAGTAGVAIGQLAEYAADGNIKLANLVMFAGPMLGIAAAGMAISKALDAQREKAEAVRKQTELLIEVEKKREEGDTAGVIEDLAAEYADILPTMRQFGIGVAEIDEIMGGNSEELERLRDLHGEYNAALGNTTGLSQGQINQLRAERDALGEVIGKLEEVDEAQGDARTQLDNLDRATREWTEYLEDTAEPAIEGNRAAIQAWHDEMRRAETQTQELDEAYKTLTGQLDQREAWLNLEEQVQDFAEAMYGGELSTREQQQALVDIQQELIEYLSGLDGVPAEKQTQILALIDQGDIGAAKAQLDALTVQRTALFKILVEQVTSAEIKQMENRLGRDINGNGVIGRAAGGPVFPGEVYAVGDNPDGSWNRTTELFVPGTTGRIYDAADSRRMLGGGTTIVNVTVPPGTTDPVAFGRMAGEAILAAARVDGPTFATTR